MSYMSMVTSESFSTLTRQMEKAESKSAYFSLLLHKLLGALELLVPVSVKALSLRNGRSPLASV